MYNPGDGLGRGLDNLLTSLNSAHIASDLTPMGLDNHRTEMHWDRVFYLAGQLKHMSGTDSWTVYPKVVG